MKPIRIVLIDDHTVLRSGLRVLLDQQEDMEVVGEAGDWENGRQVVEEMRPDVVLLDITLPGTNGVDAAAQMRALDAGIRVIALTMHEDQRYVREMLAAGAVGYVTKGAADTELVDAIRAVSRGEVFVHPSVARAVVQGYLGVEEDTEEAETDPLSERERQVVKLLALGHTNQAVADQLFISVKTVETHKARAMDKLNCRTRADLVRYALERGMLDEL